MTELRRGNTYNLPIELTDANDHPIDPTSVAKIEFTFGTVKHYYEPEGDDVRYDPENQVYIIPFTQEDTFAFKGKDVKYQTRIKYLDGLVGASEIGEGNILEVLSREVL